MIVKWHVEGMVHKLEWDNIAQGHLLWNYSLLNLVIIAFHINFKLMEIEVSLEKAEKKRKV